MPEVYILHVRRHMDRHLWIISRPVAESGSVAAFVVEAATMRKYTAAFVMEAATMSLSGWLGMHGPCFDAGLASAWSSQLASALAHVSRRQDLLTIERFHMLHVLQDRKHIVAEMREPSSTFVQWNLCVNLTRVGNTEESKLPRGSGGKKVLKAAFDSVAASASTLGLVVGDLNLKPDEVDEVIAGHPGPHNLRFIGGPGAPYPYVSCCAARQGFGMPGFAMHLAMSLAMHLAMLPRHVARCMARGMARDWQEAC